MGVHHAELTDGGTVANFLIEGAVDAVVKRLAQHTVESLVSHDTDLEEAFLAYYSEEPADAS